MSDNTAVVPMAQEVCCDCHMVFWMPKQLMQKRREDHGDFFCPNGHAQHYTGKTECQNKIERLESENKYLADRNKKLDAETVFQRKRADAYKGLYHKTRKGQ